MERMSGFNNCTNKQRATGIFLPFGKYLPALLAGLVLYACGRPRKPALHIATAANMQYAMQALAKHFEEAEGMPCELILGSSGKLTAQITEGAPFDVFVSADMKYPRALCEGGFCVDSPGVYAYGSLVLWTVAEGVEPSLQALFDPQVQHIALANPRTAPYGRAAGSVLRHMDRSGVLLPKLIYGESISQTNQFILSGNAELGFTAKSVVLSPQGRARGRWAEVADSLYKPIAQGVVVLKTRPDQLAAAQAFRAFLFSPEAREILRTFGYRTN